PNSLDLGFRERVLRRLGAEDEKRANRKPPHPVASAMPTSTSATAIQMGARIFTGSWRREASSTTPRARSSAARRLARRRRSREHAHRLGKWRRRRYPE